MLVRLLRVSVLDLETSIHQVQDPKHVVDQQTHIIVKFDTLVYREVKSALEMHGDYEDSINYKLDC